MTLRIEADGRAETGAPVVVRLDPKERILAAAYELFSRRGIRDVGVDELIRESGVAKATFYRHFASKDDLALAFLERRDQVWTTGYVVAEAMHRGDTAEQRLLAGLGILSTPIRSDDRARGPLRTKTSSVLATPSCSATSWTTRAPCTWSTRASRSG